MYLWSVGRNSEVLLQLLLQLVLQLLLLLLILLQVLLLIRRSKGGGRTADGRKFLLFFRDAVISIPNIAMVFQKKFALCEYLQLLIIDQTMEH